MKFLPDAPIASSIEDLLGFGDFVSILQSSIHGTETPFVYGVLGDWGVGKTSILRLLEDRLQRDLETGAKLVIPIWFNPWKYENETNIIYPLLHAIKHDYSRRVAPFDEAKEFGQRFLRVVATSTLALTDIGLRSATKYLTGEALKLEDVAKHLQSVRDHPDELESVFSGWADGVATLDRAFDELLCSYARELRTLDPRISDQDSVRFVILMDDLDRCLPETTIAILESIKNYLSVPRCIFVLGLNAKIIYDGVQIKYRGVRVDGRQYLEKIVNYSFYVPEPEGDKVARFVTERLGELASSDEFRSKHANRFHEAGSVVRDCFFFNPRRIKRVLNRYMFFITQYEAILDRCLNSNLVKLLILAESFPDLFQLFVNERGAVNSLISRLKEVGDETFNIEAFELKYGTTLTEIYPQVSRMRNLFKMELGDDSKIHPAELAQAVFRITRLV